MTQLRSYTAIEQSKKLAEILPIESADMWWNFYSVTTTDDTTPRIIHLDTPWVGNFNWDNKPDNVPCWSLAALLDVLPNSIYNNTDKYSQLEFSKISVAYHDMNDGIKVGSIKDNLVDACYDMIIKLKEQNLI